jgi:hypothetical protein
MTLASLAKPRAVWRTELNSTFDAAMRQCRSNSAPNLTCKAATPAFRTFVVARPAAELEPPAAADETLAAAGAEARGPPAAAVRGLPAAGERVLPAAARARGPPEGRDEAREGPPQAPQERALPQEPDEARSLLAQGREPLGPPREGRLAQPAREPPEAQELPSAAPRQAAVLRRDSAWPPD